METTLKDKFQIISKTKEIIIDMTCFLLIILFVYTAITKLYTYSSFEEGLHNSVLLKPYSHILTWFIPSSEICISILLIIPKSRWLGLLSSFLLLLFFTIYLIYMVNYGGPKSCGCGGVIEALSWTQHIYFNIFFILISGTSFYFETSLFDIHQNIKYKMEDSSSN
ncbi:MauE/DoxX family redox-associated membrane protein [Pedobacter sp. AW31-3R]|uniref:MauE/DoxX family redox-associated membrane protein n=1 Tax=Pedobacter sp. AW31-3R TaxID=3445781 RepID=UPI003FA05675